MKLACSIQHLSLSCMSQVQLWGLPGADLLWTLWSSEGHLAAVAWPHAWGGDGQAHPARGPHRPGQPLVTSHPARSHEGWFCVLSEESHILKSRSMWFTEFMMPVDDMVSPADKHILKSHIYTFVLYFRALNVLVGGHDVTSGQSQASFPLFSVFMLS